MNYKNRRALNLQKACHLNRKNVIEDFYDKICGHGSFDEFEVEVNGQLALVYDPVHIKNMSDYYMMESKRCPLRRETYREWYEDIIRLSWKEFHRAKKIAESIDHKKKIISIRKNGNSYVMEIQKRKEATEPFINIPWRGRFHHR